MSGSPLSARVRAVATWSLHGSAPTLGEVALAPGMYAAPDPVRPQSVPTGAWRRMSRLARLAAVVTAPVVGDDRGLPLFFGTSWGEFSSTATFLRTLFTKGPMGASPLAFQNSVHNAAPGHLSITFGLRGPSETICAGPATALATFQRALCSVALRKEPALVVIADDLGRDVQAGLTLAGGTAAFGEGAAAFLLEPGEGVSLVSAGTWSRHQGYPGEVWPRGEGGHDLRLGLFPAGDAIALALGREVGFQGARLRSAG